MDATNQKTTASVFVTLLVGSIFLGAIAPTAEAAHLGPGEDVTIDVREPSQSVTIQGVGTFSTVSVPTSPLNFKLRHSTAYNLLIVGIETGGSGYGYAGAATRVELVNMSTGTAQVLISTDLGTGPTGTSRNATFLLNPTTVPGPGLYELRAQGTGNSIANILFYPLEDLTVTATASNTVYTPAGNTVVTIRTADATGNIAASLTDCDVRPIPANTKTCLGFLPAPNATGTDGSFVFVSSLPMGVGNWPIYAFRNNTHTDYYDAPNGDSIPERFANTTLAITPVTLGLTTIQSSAFVGFSSPVAFRATFPTTNNVVFKATSGAFPSDVTVTRQNITLTSPTGLNVAYNVTRASIGTSGTYDLDGGATEICWNTTNTLGVVACDATKVPDVNLNLDTGDIWVNSSDDMDGTNVWATGTYTFNLGLETAGGATTAPEYVATTSWTPATPAAVNLQLSPLTVDVPVNGAGTLPTTNTAVSASQGVVSATLTISGNTAFRHPFCDRPLIGDACSATWETMTHDFRANITMRGDVLPGWNITSYTPSTGAAVLAFTPTANGTIFIDVAWKNLTTTAVLPVARGANVTVDVTNITVDATSTITARVADAFGNTVSNANVYVFPRQALTSTTPPAAATYQGTGSTVVFGTGGPGAGQGGLYTFSLKPSQVQDLLVFAVVGSGSNVNYSYAPFSVIPTTDLNVTLNTTQTMAALRTHIVMNVTNTSAAGQTGTDANFKVYFLTAAQRTNLMSNGTTALFTTGTVPTAQTTVGSSAFGTNLNVSLVAGDYYVYVCSGISAITDCRTATRDNRNNMPLFNVSAYSATFTPSQVANNPDIQGATSVNIRVVDRNGAPANGTISVRANGTLLSGGTGITATVTNGQVNISVTGANTGIGDVEWNFDPKEATGTEHVASDRLLGVLNVVAGNLTWQPSKVNLGQGTLVTVRLTNFTGAGLPGRVIRLCSFSLNTNFPTSLPQGTLTTGTGSETANCPNADVTQADGSAGVSVTPTGLSPLGIYINGSFSGKTIPVTAGTLTLVASPTNPQAGGNVTLTASQPGVGPAAGIRVLVLRDGTQVLDSTTNNAGQATLTGLVAGNYTATAIRSGFDNGTASFTVGRAPVTNTTNATFELSNLTTPATITAGTPFDVGVTVQNTGTASGSATALLFVNGQQAGSESVTLAAGERRNLLYDGNVLRAAGTYTIIVRIGTTEIGPNTITVGQSPTTPTTPVTTATPPVTSATPPATSVTPPVTSATPPATPPVTTTPTTTPEPTEDEPEVPGFEVVALLAAIGVALLVLRRRK